MELMEFRKDYIENIKADAAVQCESTSTVFTDTTLNNLQELSTIPDYSICYSSGKHGRKSYKIDAYAFDDCDQSMFLFINDFDGDNELLTLTRTEAISLFEKLHTFIDGCYNGSLRYDIEISTPAYDLVEQMIQMKDVIRKIRLFILTDKSMSSKISSFDAGELCGKPIEYNVWDITRLFNVITSGDEREAIEIDFRDFTDKGLPCLEASSVTAEGVNCYLSVIGGEILADLYDKYGSKLLEGNVRSFLSTKVKVNKDIRKTIIGAEDESKKMFFAYNNGISATATDISFFTDETGKYISTVKNLQIVNGGQTTASLSTTRFKDKVNLDGIFVQMKLTVIPDHELAQQLIPKISKCSNSQTRVSEADFFSNHEFNVRMEKISRRIYAPAVNGQQYETHWFFERARGQYEQEQRKYEKEQREQKNKFNKAKFQLINPKSQKITKTDIAKYVTTWMELPHYASLGAQKNFSKFAAIIVDKWNEDNTKFNDMYFQKMISKAIIYNKLDNMVKHASWYDKGYKANIVIYTMSYLHYLIRTQYKHSNLDLMAIWNKQSIPDVLETEFVKLTKYVFDHITDKNRPITNVTEWCKKEECWKRLINKPYVLSKGIEKALVSKEKISNDERNAQRDQQLSTSIQVSAEVIKRGAAYWLSLLEWGKAKSLLSPVDESFISAATKMDYGRIPSEKQCQRIINIEARMLEEGFSVNKG